MRELPNDWTVEKIFFSNTYERKHSHRLTTNIDGAEKGTLVETVEFAAKSR